MIVYRQRKDGVFEIGETSLELTEVNRTNSSDPWCDRRICETWNERDALRIVNALTGYES